MVLLLLKNGLYSKWQDQPSIFFDHPLLFWRWATLFITLFIYSNTKKSSCYSVLFFKVGGQLLIGENISFEMAEKITYSFIWSTVGFFLLKLNGTLFWNNPAGKSEKTYHVVFKFKQQVDTSFSPSFLVKRHSPLKAPK